MDLVPLSFEDENSVGSVSIHLISDHPLINRTVHELGLTVDDFLVGYGYHPDSLIYTRGHHMRHKDIESTRVPYQLEEHMRIDFDQLNWYGILSTLDISKSKFIPNY